MYRGYVKLWRKSLDAGWLKNSKLWWFWCWCLMKASYKEIDVIIGFQRVHLMPGDFIFGLHAASKETYLSIQEIRTALTFLSKHQNLTIKTTNKFSIVSITNWETYQGDESDNQQASQQTTNKPLTTNKNVKKEKKEKIIPEVKDKFLDTVYLTTEEHQKLVNKYGALTTDKAIEILNNGIMAKGYKYKSHYHAVIGWPMKEAIGGGNGKGTYANRKDIRGHEIPDETERINAEYYAKKAAKEAAANKAAGNPKGNDVSDF